MLYMSQSSVDLHQTGHKDTCTVLGYAVIDYVRLGKNNPVISAKSDMESILALVHGQELQCQIRYLKWWLDCLDRKLTLGLLIGAGSVTLDDLKRS